MGKITLEEKYEIERYLASASDSSGNDEIVELEKLNNVLVEELRKIPSMSGVISKINSANEKAHTLDKDIKDISSKLNKILAEQEIASSI
ncbi:MAG: hypothetical protein IJI22_00035 [Bacilli bacterium]|nr:hypothetical protein [Bacilli bacterium]